MPENAEKLSPVFAVDEESLTAKIAVAAFRQIDARALSAATINRLPLSREGVDRWSPTSDLYSLVSDLCSVRTTMTTEQGNGRRTLEIRRRVASHKHVRLQKTYWVDLLNAQKRQLSRHWDRTYLLELG